MPKEMRLSSGTLSKRGAETSHKFCACYTKKHKNKTRLKKDEKKRKTKIKEGKTNGNYLMMKTWTPERIPILKWLANEVKKKKKEKRNLLFTLIHF